MASTKVPPHSAERLLHCGRLADARRHYWEDVAAADSSEDPVALAEAAVGLGGLWVNEHRSTLERARVTAVQRRALAGLDQGGELCGRLRVRLAAEHAYATGDCAALLVELNDTRHCPGAILRAEALSLAHHCLLGPRDTRVRLALADELVAVAPLTGRSIDGLMGLAWRTVDFFLAGDRRAARSLRELRDALDTERCDALSYLLAGIDVTVAMRAGRLVDAEHLAEVCYRLGEDVGDADSAGWYGAQLVAIRWMQGRSAEVMALVRELDEATTVDEMMPAFTAATASVAASAGDLDLARTTLARLGGAGLGNVQQSSCWLATLAGVCDAAFALGDVAAAKEAYGLLEPFANLPVMASLAVACFGSAHRPLGLAAATMEDVDLAVAHFESAVVADQAIGNRPCHTIDTMKLAEALERRGGSTDAARAEMLRREAMMNAERLGLTGWVRQWSAVSSNTDIVCRRAGKMWTVRAAEHVAAVPHSVGMTYLTELISHPDVEIAAVDLAMSHALTLRQESRDELLDPAARAAYRRRIDELHGEIDDADACADIERAANARLELDSLIEELSRATGLDGRSRMFANGAERARVSVQKAIARALAAIADADRVVADQLDSRIVTGKRCVFLRQAP